MKTSSEIEVPVDDASVSVRVKADGWIDLRITLYLALQFVLVVTFRTSLYQLALTPGKNFEIPSTGVRTTVLYRRMTVREIVKCAEICRLGNWVMLATLTKIFCDGLTKNCHISKHLLH